MKNILLIVSVFIIVLTLSFRIIDALDSPELKSTTCLENYTQEELNFFSEVGFRYHNSASKWEKDITVSIKGNPMQSDILLIDSIIEELKPLIFPIRINRVNDAGNLIVEFLEDTKDRQDMGFTNIEYLVEFTDLDMENVKTFRYSDLDKSSLKILYSDCIPIKLKRKTFIKACQIRNKQDI